MYSKKNDVFGDVFQFKILHWIVSLLQTETFPLTEVNRITYV